MRTAANNLRLESKPFATHDACLRGPWFLAFVPGNRLFGQVGDPPRTGIVQKTIGTQQFSCEFENERRIVEPGKIARGNLARSIFYMCEEYRSPSMPRC